MRRSRKLVSTPFIFMSFNESFNDYSERYNQSASDVVLLLLIETSLELRVNNFSNRNIFKGLANPKFRVNPSKSP